MHRLLDLSLFLDQFPWQCRGVQWARVLKTNVKGANEQSVFGVFLYYGTVDAEWCVSGASLPEDNDHLLGSLHQNVNC